MTAGNHGHPFSTRDISLDSVLPTDDAAWTRGEVNPSHPLSLSASSHIRAAPFARTCQASHLLGRVKDHVNDRRMCHEFRYQEATALDQALQALSLVLIQQADADHSMDDPHFCESLSICYSAMLYLYDEYICPDRIPEAAPEEHLIMHRASLDGTLRVNSLVLDLARKIQTKAQTGDTNGAGPFLLDCLYSAAWNCEYHHSTMAKVSTFAKSFSDAWSVKESNDNDSRANLEEIKGVLGLLNYKWKAAGMYQGQVNLFLQNLMPLQENMSSWSSYPNST